MREELERAGYVFMDVDGRVEVYFGQEHLGWAQDMEDAVQAAEADYLVDPESNPLVVRGLKD